jgi:hypothetical protein
VPWGETLCVQEQGKNKGGMALFGTRALTPWVRLAQRRGHFKAVARA